MYNNFKIGNLYRFQDHPSGLVERFPILEWNNEESRWTLTLSSPTFHKIDNDSRCVFLGGTNSIVIGAFLVSDKIIGIKYDMLS